MVFRCNALSSMRGGPPPVEFGIESTDYKQVINELDYECNAITSFDLAIRYVVTYEW